MHSCRDHMSSIGSQKLEGPSVSWKLLKKCFCCTHFEKTLALIFPLSHQTFLTSVHRHQWFVFSRNIAKLTPNIIYFQYLTKPCLDQSNQKTFHLILKKYAPVDMPTAQILQCTFSNCWYVVYDHCTFRNSLCAHSVLIVAILKLTLPLHPPHKCLNNVKINCELHEGDGACELINDLKLRTVSYPEKWGTLCPLSLN